MPHRIRLEPMLFLGILFLAACGDDRIVTYLVPKESPSAVTPPVTAEMPPTATETHREVDWTVPAGWVEQPAGSMRVGSFLVKGPGGRTADMSVIPLSGQAGGDLSNINRWRGQIQLNPISEGEMNDLIEIRSFGGKKMKIVEFASDAPLTESNRKQRILAAIFVQGDQSWFFKMMGDDDVVKEAKPAFFEFLSNLHWHDHG